MKIRLFLLVLVAGAAAVAQGQVFNPVRTFKEGTSETYSMKMDMESSAGQIGMSMEMKNTVKKVYENGDADIETAVTGMTVSIAGQQMKPPAGKPTTMRVNKFGAPVNATKNRNNSMIQFASQFGEKEIKVGETVSFENVDKDNPKIKTKGTAKLVEITNGVAVLTISVDSWTEASDKPMHLDGTSRVNASTGVLDKFEGKATNLPGMGAPGMTIATATFVVERKG